MPKTKVIGQRLSAVGFLVERYRRQKIHRLKDTTKVGRGGVNDIILNEETVSEEHVVIKYEHGCFVLYDLASKNHTYLNDKLVQKQSLMDGDVIKLGNIGLVFKEVKDSGL